MKHIIQNEYPEYIQTDDFRKFELFRKYEIPEFNKRDYRFRFITNSGIVFSILGVDQGSFFPQLRKTWFLFYTATGNFLFRKKKYLGNDKYLLIHNIWSLGGFYHWMVESLVRLWVYKEDLSKYTLLLPEESKKYPFIIESLRFFDIKKILYYQRNHLLLVKNISFADNPPQTGFFNPKLLKELRNHYLQKVKKINNKGYPKRIFISRQKSKTRKIQNWNELLPTLEKFNIVPLFLEDLPLEEQVIICQNAELVIGPHGAGLSNIMFQSENSTVIEILSDQVDRYMIFWSLSQAIGLKYYCLFSKQLHPKKSFDDSDMLVSINKLESLLKKVIG